MSIYIGTSSFTFIGRLQEQNRIAVPKHMVQFCDMGRKNILKITVQKMEEEK